MSDLPSMPLFVDDYEAATAHLTLEEDGAYNRLLRLCWRTAGCSVPDDAEWIARRMRVDRETFDRVLAPIIEEFFTRANGRISQRRQKREHRYVTQVSRSRKEAGRKGGIAKARKTTEKASSKAKDLPEANASKALAPTPTPTLKKKDDAREARSVLSRVLGEDLAGEFIRYRSRKKAPLTPTAADLLCKKLARISEQHGMQPRDAVALLMARGWQSIEPDWIKPEHKSGSDTAARYTKDFTPEDWAEIERRRKARAGA